MNIDRLAAASVRRGRRDRFPDKLSRCGPEHYSGEKQAEEQPADESCMYSGPIHFVENSDVCAIWVIAVLYES